MTTTSRATNLWSMRRTAHGRQGCRACYAWFVSDVDVLVVGAGVVGLACAASLALRGDSVLVIERNANPGEETSSRNSGVIHAGLYYPADSLKSRLCTRGRQQLYARAVRDGIPHRKIGKLLVASAPEEEARLHDLRQRAEQNEVPGLRWVEQRELRALEPNLHACLALLSPESGIVDAHALLASYRAEAIGHGAELCLRTRVRGIERVGDLYRVETEHCQTLERETVLARSIVNAAGLHATDIASLAGLPVRQLGYVQQLCKGDYFQLTTRVARMVSHLIYPLPVHAGLGVHLTFDMGGQLRAGPDTEYIPAIDYCVNPNKGASFCAAVSRYLPGVSEADFAPDYAGLRPKLQGPGDPFRDFVIEDAGPHGLPRFVNLLGIESPGLTASEAIGEYVRGLLPN
jgi:L-2-hydroxyglutarate oxidase LhgO